MYNDEVLTSERMYGKMITHYFHIPCDIYSSFCKVELLSKVILAFFDVAYIPKGSRRAQNCKTRSVCYSNIYMYQYLIVTLGRNE